MGEVSGAAMRGGEARVLVANGLLVCGGAMRDNVVWSCAVAVLPRSGFPCIAPGRPIGPPGVMIRGTSVTSERFFPFHLSLFFFSSIFLSSFYSRYFISLLR